MEETKNMANENVEVKVETKSKPVTTKTKEAKKAELKKSSVSLSKEVFGIKPNTQAIFDVIMSERASQRQGTSHTKTRAEVSGGGAKPWRQKGTGRARAGSNRSPIWVGGGITFGPRKERNYTLQVNKKVRKLALKSALTLKANEQAIFIEDLKLEKPSTKEFISLINKHVGDGYRKVLIVTENETILKSLANVQNVFARKIASLSVEVIINVDAIVMSQTDVKFLEEVLK